MQSFLGLGSETVYFVGVTPTDFGGITSLPNHKSGDLIIVATEEVNEEIVAPLLGGWTFFFRRTFFDLPDNYFWRGWYKIAETDNSPLGAWSGVGPQKAMIYRGFSVPGANSHSYSTTQNTTWPALTLQQTNGTSLVVAMTYAEVTINGPINGPTGYISRNNGVWDSGSKVSSFVGGSLGQSTSVQLSVFELKV